MTISSFKLVAIVCIASFALCPDKVTAQGSSSGTYYYDVKMSECPGGSSVQGVADGVPKCASNTPGPNQLTLQQLGSNNVIAIGELYGGSEDARAQYCGKQVIVTANGNSVAAPDGGDFFVWDGCEACASSNRVDFSVSGLLAVSSDACTLGVVPGVDYQITDTQVKEFVA